jgi:hypothetical protein
MGPGVPRPRGKSVSILVRMRPEVLERLKLAASKRVPYQTLLKRFVVERLHEEEELAEE